jgi:large subunit ribosomal protein L2
VKPGNAMPIGSIPVGTIVHNVETKPGAGGSLARSAGTYAMVAGRDGGYVIIKLKSGETRMVPASGMASIGAVSNPDHLNEVVGKAGRTRWKGKRPVSRGIARNPVDHPNGGRTNGGKHWATPWGKPTKGYKTRTNKRTTKLIVRSRHKAKKS